MDPNAADKAIHTGMYPALPGAGDPPSRLPYGYANSSSAAVNSSAYEAAPDASQLTGQGSLGDNSPWGNETNSTLRVKIADDYKIAPPVGLLYVVFSVICLDSMSAAVHAVEFLNMPLHYNHSSTPSQKLTSALYNRPTLPTLYPSGALVKLVSICSRRCQCLLP